MWYTWDNGIDICLPQMGDTQICTNHINIYIYIIWLRKSEEQQIDDFFTIRLCSKLWDKPNWFLCGSDDFGYNKWKCDHISFWHALHERCPTSKASPLPLWAFCLNPTSFGMFRCLVPVVRVARFRFVTFPDRTWPKCVGTIRKRCRIVE
jgi:hypothetical protein